MNAIRDDGIGSAFGSFGGRIQETRLPGDGKRKPLSIDDTEKASFGDLLSDGIQSVAAHQDQVRVELEKFATGKSDGVQDVMLAMGKSEVAFALMLEVRNRLVDAWREITRIQV
ncbi:MAG: flagellar hook-basal body complex protein FliE [Planctomycetes bacterium]|nr:flagellar hook-basal body complex protein FliE [Planctomycetota bacterium]